MISKQKTQRTVKTQQGIIKKAVYFNAPTTLELDNFLESHPFKAYSIHLWGDMFHFAAYFNKDLNTSVKEFVGDPGITNVTLCRSFTGAQVYINNLIPKNDRNGSLVREKLLPKVEKERLFESVYQKIEKITDPRDLLEDEEIVRLIKRDPAQVYAYFQICNNIF